VRHKACAELLYDGLQKLGLELFVKNPELRLPTVTGVVVPGDVNWKDVTTYMMKNHRIEISGGLGGTAGKIWRIGLMGYNATPENVRRVIRVLGEALEYCRNQTHTNGKL
jgi:alanine-glyoxylate transaminase/serine-glyoxylate transaminase/serine-pyruvate transaminase